LDKLEPSARTYVFVGYSRTQKCYRCFDHVDRKFYTFADVTFFESIPYFALTIFSYIPAYA